MPDNACWQDLVSVHREGCELLCHSIIITHSISRKLRPIVYALQHLDRNFANLVAPPTGDYAKCLVRCKVHLVP